MQRSAEPSVLVRLSWLRLAAALTVALACGCASPYQDYCETKMKCLNGNETDVEACTIIEEANDDVAAAKQCDGQWQSFSDCRDSKGKCGNNNQWTEEACNPVREKLQDCEQ